MFEALISTSGAWFLVAVGATFLAALVDQAGAPRSPTEEPLRPGLGMLLLALGSLLTPGMLLVHAHLTSLGAAPPTRVVLLALPIGAVILGAIIGGLLGMATRPARIIMRMASVVFSLGALIVTVFATLPSLETAWRAAQNNWTIEAPR